MTASKQLCSACLRNRRTLVPPRSCFFLFQSQYHNVREGHWLPESTGQAGLQRLVSVVTSDRSLQIRHLPLKCTQRCRCSQHHGTTNLTIKKLAAHHRMGQMVLVVAVYNVCDRECNSLSSCPPVRHFSRHPCFSPNAAHLCSCKSNSYIYKMAASGCSGTGFNPVRFHTETVHSETLVERLRVLQRAQCAECKFPNHPSCTTADSDKF